MKVHTALGPGIFERAYHACLSYQFAADGLHFQHHVRLPLVYNGLKLANAYQIDFVVENCLVNFHVPHLREGIHRKINGPESDL